MRAAIRGKGLEAHHIIEKRFGFNIDSTVAVTRAETKFLLMRGAH